MPTPLLPLLLAALPALQAGERPDLFLDPVGPAAALPAGATTLRQRAVVVAAELLADGAAGSGRQLRLGTFEGEFLVLRDLREVGAGGGAPAFCGELADGAGAALGEAAFAVVGDAVAGSLRFGGRLLKLEPIGAGAHALVEVDEPAMPTCATRAQHTVHAAPAPSGSAAGTSKSISQPLVDVMVVYTPQAKNGQGGTNGILARINLAITESNAAFAASDVAQRLRLVRTEELVGYTETGNFGTELSRLRSKNDGWFDSIHATRDAYGADMVSMIVNGSQYCGIGYLMGTPSHAFESSAFTVVARTCMTGYYSFGHELGHNLGSHHDIANTGGPGSYPYSYGWRTANGSYRTIMAYAPGSRVNRWSNPSKTWNGQSLGSTNQAENWKSLNNTAAISSQWRCAVPQRFGTAKLTSSFLLPTIAHSGKPVADGSGNFKVRIEGAEPGNPAITFYGPTSTELPFMGGTRYVGSPFLRLPPVVLDANGNGEWDFPITDFAPGDEVYVQGWFRDPAQFDGTGAGLTEGLRIDVCQYDL